MMSYTRPSGTGRGEGWGSRYLVALGNQRRNSLSKNLRQRQQANHQPVLLAESEEASRMYRDAVSFEQPDRQRVAARIGGRAQRRIPAALAGQPGDLVLSRKA